MIAHWLTHFIIKLSGLIFPLEYQMSNSVNAWTLDAFKKKNHLHLFGYSCMNHFALCVIMPIKLQNTSYLSAKIT